MSAIKEALSMIGYNSMGMTEAEIKIIKDLIKEIAKRDKVIEAFSILQLTGNPTPARTIEMLNEVDAALSQLEDKP